MKLFTELELRYFVQLRLVLYGELSRCMWVVCDVDRLYQSRSYLPVMFVGDVNNRMKDLIVSFSQSILIMSS